MKKAFISLFIILLSLSFYGLDEPETKLDEPDVDTEVNFSPIKPEAHHRQVALVVTHLLRESHYKKRELDDSLGMETFDRYIESLDPQKLYFLASDIAEFKQQRHLFDDYIGSGQVRKPFDMFNVYQERMAERLRFIFERLNADPFDYTIDENIDLDREDNTWAKSSAELDELWRKRLKHEALNLKLADKEWEGIQETLSKRYKRTQKNVRQFQSEDVFQILMNAYAESYDPHTNYFSPKNFDDFRIRMSQSLEGIGARLTTENDYTVVSEIVPGGPADKGKQLHPNDRITGVAQGMDGEFVDVVGWRIDDVVQLIRGKKGSVVRLAILPADVPAGSKTETIAITRDKIKLEDQAAKADTLEILHDGKNMKFGIVEIPSFYSDFDGRRRGDKNYKSTTRDVRRIIEEFAPENVDGIIIDLRRNGGGFLNEAVDLTGLFIDNGPVVQVRNSIGDIEVESDYNPEVVYNGPLAVIVDRLSASASEIFAAAIQDYGRGVIIGSQTFGKGTVQNAVPLSRYLRDRENKYGQLKLTIAKFYRIDGRSTQHVGVMPDMNFPSRFNLMEIGESSRENALLWDQIRPVRYNKQQDISGIIPLMKQRQSSRLSANEDYNSLLDDLNEFEKNIDKEIFSLMESVRKQERDAQKEDDEDEEDEAEKKKKKKDLLLTESAHILGDYIHLTKID